MEQVAQALINRPKIVSRLWYQLNPRNDVLQHLVRSLARALCLTA